MTRLPISHPIPRRAGFVAILAITLVILVAAALVVMGRQFRSDFVRTRAERTEAQLRQLLTAGAASATSRANSDHWPHQPVTLPLLPELTANGARLTLIPVAEGAIDIEAHLDGRRMAQTLRFVRDGDRWRLQSAELAQ